jgi:3-methyladenine DNA glycosylase AlkD
MEFILDDRQTELKFQQILKLIQLHKNGDVASMMKQKGINYKLNLGVSLIELREIAQRFEPNHLLALKLWNKQWRETIILATLLDDHKMVTEEQMDFWTKSADNVEIAEQLAANLWVKCKFAFAKALEWCRGKKHFVRYTGLHLIGRLAITEKIAIDEMFDPFFDELRILAKDKRLNIPLYRSVLALSKRSDYLYERAIELAKNMQLSDSENASELGKELFDILTNKA